MARQLLIGPETPESPFPFYLKGLVVKGFGRGSRELGIPTANLPGEYIQKECEKYENGIYYGYASVNQGEVYPMVMSLGWNPFYKNQKRSGEVHIIHDFQKDFYNEELRVICLGYIRPELDYVSVEQLISDIQMDIKAALTSLNRPAYEKFQQDHFFTD